jgi:hypothetical protein
VTWFFFSAYAIISFALRARNRARKLIKPNLNNLQGYWTVSEKFRFKTQKYVKKMNEFVI